MAHILADGEFTLELGLLLPVIVGPVIQNTFVTPEVYSTFVAETKQFLEVGLHRRQLLPLVVLVMVLLVQQVPDVIVITNNKALCTWPIYLMISSISLVACLFLTQSRMCLPWSSLSWGSPQLSHLQTANTLSHLMTRPSSYWVTQTNERSSHLRLHFLDSSSPPGLLAGHQRPAGHAAQVT